MKRFYFVLYSVIIGVTEFLLGNFLFGLALIAVSCFIAAY